MTNAMTIIGEGRTRSLAFWIGVLAVVLGVGLHLPAFWMFSGHGVDPLCPGGMCGMGAGMSMDPAMTAGMVLIVGGVIAAGYGLLERSDRSLTRAPSVLGTTVDGPMTAAHWRLVAILIAALVIDVMKPATLGFVIPGMMRDYGLARADMAFLPLVALSGTAIGSLIWGVMADRVGRRATILLAAIMFIGTSICGAMPSFQWNLVMCFMMGLPAGGMLPIAFTLLSEMAPARLRGWLLVLLGGIALAGGYLAASTAATLLEPLYGWRSLWLLGLPTGLLLVVFSRGIPEPPSFLVLHGRHDEADAVMKRYGLSASVEISLSPVTDEFHGTGSQGVFGAPLLPMSLALNAMALVWGLVNFGLLLWMPTNLQATGLSPAEANALLAKSSLWALPIAVVAAAAYHRWGGKRLLVVFALVTAAGLFALGAPDSMNRWFGIAPLHMIALIMIGANGVIAVLLPLAAESYPTGIRGEATGYVAGFSKGGGIVAQVISLTSAVPALAPAALILAVPITVSALVVARYVPSSRLRLAAFGVARRGLLNRGARV